MQAGVPPIDLNVTKIDARTPIGCQGKRDRHNSVWQNTSAGVLLILPASLPAPRLYIGGCQRSVVRTTG